MADSPVNVSVRDETVIGQPQSKQPDPHDGKTIVNEVVAVVDRHILDPNDELAVQIPEGVGASTAGSISPLGRAFKDGTAEEQFAAASSKKK